MTEQGSFLVDMFILEVGEGRMPKPGSDEHRAYEEYRAEELEAAGELYAGKHRDEA